MLITNWNTTALNLVQAELVTEINKVLSKHGLLPINGLGFSYTASKATVRKLELVIKPQNFVEPKGYVTNNHDAETLKDLGCPIGTKFNSSKFGTCEVTGYNSRAKRCPIQSRTAAGQSIKSDVTSVTRNIISYPTGYTPKPKNQQAGTLTLRPFPGQR